MGERTINPGRLAAIAVLAAFAVPALGAQVILETSTSTGMLFGTSRELVLSGAYVVSQLDWAIRPLVIAGSELRVSTPSGFHASIQVCSGIPGNTGRITDKDFLNYDGEVTHYSEHDCFTEGALLLDARIGHEFALEEKFAIEPFAGVSVMRFKWTARDGYLQYPPHSSYPYTPWDPQTTPKVPVYGTGIVYQQTWYIPMAGVRAGIGFGERFVAAVELGFSPYLWMNDLDNHELRLVDFQGTLYGGLLLDPSLRISWQISPTAQLSFGVGYRVIWGLAGDTLKIGAGVEGETGPELDPGVRERYEGTAGTSFDALSVSLSLVLSL